MLANAAAQFRAAVAILAFSVLVHDGEARVIRRRETIDDLLALETA